MTWDQLLEETALRAKADPADAGRVLNAFFDIVIAQMETEERIMLRPDFGYFEMREAGGDKALREQSLRKARRTPVFKKSSALKKQLRQSDEDYLAMLRESGRAAQAARLLRKRESNHSA